MLGFAKDAYGEIISFDPHKHHTILSGVTRSGKSSTMYSILARAATDPRVAIVGLDASGLTLAPFEDLGQSLIATGTHEPQRYVEILENLVSFMDCRIRELRRLGLDKLTPTETTPTVLCVLEEYGGILAACDQYDVTVKPTDRIKPRVIGAIGRIQREAEKVNLRLICSIQRPDATVLGSGAERENYSRRLTHRMSSVEGVKMLNDDITPEQISKVLTLPAGVGLLNEPAEPYRFFRSAFIIYSEYLQRITATYQTKNQLYREIAGEISHCK